MSQRSIRDRILARRACFVTATLTAGFATGGSACWPLTCLKLDEPAESTPTGDTQPSGAPSHLPAASEPDADSLPPTDMIRVPGAKSEEPTPPGAR